MIQWLTLAVCLEEYLPRKHYVCFGCYYFFTLKFYWELNRLNREGNGTPLQYSYLENPMDGGDWQAAVNGVAKSWTQLSDFTFTFHFHALEKEMAIHSSVSCLENPRDRGAWWAAVYGVAQSDTTEATQQQQQQQQQHVLIHTFLESESCSVMSDSLRPHGILQARILEWVAFPFSRGSSQPRDKTWVSFITGRFFTS